MLPARIRGFGDERELRVECDRDVTNQAAKELVAHRTRSSLGNRTQQVPTAESGTPPIGVELRRHEPLPKSMLASGPARPGGTGSRRQHRGRAAMHSTPSTTGLRLDRLEAIRDHAGDGQGRGCRRGRCVADVEGAWRFGEGEVVQEAAVAGDRLGPETRGAGLDVGRL